MEVSDFIFQFFAPFINYFVISLESFLQFQFFGLFSKLLCENYTVESKNT